MNPPNSKYITVDPITPGGAKLYRLSCGFIPDVAVGMDGCYIQDKIGVSLGGTLIQHPTSQMRHYWCFPKDSLALDHLTLCALCLMGDDSYYRKLKADVVKTRSVTGNDCNQIVVAGYPMEENKKSPSGGVVGYYLLAHKQEPPDQPHLVIAIPSRQHSCIRAGGPATRKALGKGDSILFVRLL